MYRCRWPARVCCDDVVYVVYSVVLGVVIVVVCCGCIHPLHGDVFMCRDHEIC